MRGFATHQQQQISRVRSVRFRVFPREETLPVLLYYHTCLHSTKCHFTTVDSWISFLWQHLSLASFTGAILQDIHGISAGKRDRHLNHWGIHVRRATTSRRGSQANLTTANSELGTIVPATNIQPTRSATYTDKVMKFDRNATSKEDTLGILQCRQHPTLRGLWLLRLVQRIEDEVLSRCM